MSNKRTLKYAVKCKAAFETNKVADYFKKEDNSLNPFGHWKFVLSHKEGKTNGILQTTVNYLENYPVISFEEWEKLTEDFTLENSAVRGGEELINYCKENEIENIYGKYPNQQYWVKNNKWECSSIINRNTIPLSLYLQLLEQPNLSNSVNSQTEPTRKVLGYNLIKEEYREAASKIAGNVILKGRADYEFQSTSPMHRRIEKAGVLDLWFEPVYEPEFPLPKIGGQSGKVVGDYLVYGCQKVHLSLFGTNNCDLRSINIYGTNIEQSTIKEIRNYLTENKINFKF